MARNPHQGPPLKSAFTKKEMDEIRAKKPADLETAFWVVEKVEEWSKGKFSYKLMLRASPLNPKMSRSRKFEPKIGVLIMPVSEKIFHQSKVGQMAKVQVYLGPQVLPVPPPDGKTTGARKLFRNKRKTDFSELDA
jgi:hypothetical protein